MAQPVPKLTDPELSNVWPPAPTVSRTEATPLSVRPDGKAIAYVAGSSVYVRSIDEPNWAIKFDGHKSRTRVARFSPSGHLVASADESGIVKVWQPGPEDRPHDHVEKHSHTVFAGDIADLAWDADGTRLLVVGAGKNTRGKCIMADTGNTLGDIAGHSGRMTAVAMRPKRPYRAVSADESGAVGFHDGPPMKPNRMFTSIHASRVLGAAFSPDGNSFATVSAIPNSRIAVQTIDSSGRASDLVLLGTGKDGHSGTISSVAWAPDSTRLATASADKTVRIWDVSSKTLIDTLTVGSAVSYPVPHLGQFAGLVWLPGSPDRLIALDLMGNFVHFVVGQQKPVRVVATHTDGITAGTAIASDCGQTLISGGSDGRVLSWDLAEDAPDPTVPAANSLSRRVTTLLGPPHTSRGDIADSADDDVKVISWANDVRSLNADGPDSAFSASAAALADQPKGAIRALAEPAGQAVTVALLASRSAVAVVRDGSTAVDEVKIPVLDKQPTSIASRGSWILVGDEDGRLWSFTIRAAAGEAASLVPFTDPSSKTSVGRAIEQLQFSPDSKHVAAGGTGGPICVFAYDYSAPSGGKAATASWKIATRSWTAHTGTISALRWHPEGRILASAGTDNAIRLWTLDDQWARVVRMEALKEPAAALVWRKTAEGEQLLSLSADGSIKVWRFGS